MMRNIKTWFESGTPWIWLNAGAVSFCILLVTGLLLLIAYNGLGHFWPKQIAAFDQLEVDGGTTAMIGEIVDHESVPRARIAEGDDRILDDRDIIDRYLIKTGNRDLSGLDFVWVLGAGMSDITYPAGLMAVERLEWGNIYGYLVSVMEDGQQISSGEEDADWDLFQQIIEGNNQIHADIRHIERDLIGAINYRMEQLRLQERELELTGELDTASAATLAEEQTQLQADYDSYYNELSGLYESLNKYTYVVRIADGREIELSMAQVVRAYRPNAMNLFNKVGFYLAKIWEFVSDEPREANTEGGIYPAIFGTVIMVLIMAVMVTPFGVIAAVYLREYAKQGPVVRTIRIAVNNLAGVPSIVYGVFGLGFFVYFLGGNIDELFFSTKLPSPTFGTPGLLWASLTLAILTLPVVIVSTEEGLSRVPKSIREGSLALGATKAETLIRTVLPMTASAMMTGLILAVARAAGEVAPLMLVGVVKLAPSLPLDGNFPYMHLDRKFMHLGFHIYDVGFQSPNVEAARPLVYATALLLVLIIVVLNLAAIHIRNKLREKYRASEQH
ncbi:MAG: phosphate ABC transporter permease PstA [Gammaproteobacteria bacterium]